MTTVGLCIICHDRPTELLEALASAGDGWDEIAVVDMASDPPLIPVPSVTWQRSDENLGVTAGRNRLAEACRADVLTFLDDDAVFLGDAASRLRQRFEVEGDLGLVAFRVVRPGGARMPLEYPFRGRPREDAEARPCAYFVGCGYAIRRSALESAGGYDEQFFYSTEEVDLSFRLMRAGWQLSYDPSITIEHRPSARGRSVAPRVSKLVLRNQLTVARRYLPAPVAVIHGGVWAAWTLRSSVRAGTLRPWLEGWKEGLGGAVDRRPLPWRLLWEIHRLGGRVLW